MSDEGEVIRRLTQENAALREGIGEAMKHCLDGNPKEAIKALMGASRVGKP